MKKRRTNSGVKLNSYEREVEDLLDFKSLKPPTPQRQNSFKSAAKETLKDLKAARTNIRMDPNDMIAIRTAAKRAGLPYQTFIAQILHLYVTGQLLNVDEVKRLIASGIFGSKKAT